MPEVICIPDKPCKKLDGRMLIGQTLHGPIFRAPGDIGLGDIKGKAVLRPYFHFIYHQQWVPQEACRAPVRNIIGLTPGETMTFETRHVEQVDFTRLVQDAFETSEVVTTSGPVSQMQDREGFDVTDVIWMVGRHIGLFGSFLETVGTFVGAVVGGPVGAVVGNIAGSVIDGWLGGDDSGGSGTGNYGTQNAIDETLEAVTRSESRRTVTETTTSRSTRYERAITRTFTNPYRDRSVQLRFIPIFRRFTVITTFFQFYHGLVLDLVKPQFRQTKLSPRLGDFIQRMVVDPRIISVASSELGLQDMMRATKKTKAESPLNAHLNANAEFYGKRYLRYLFARRDLDTLQPAVLGALKKAAGKQSAGIEHAFVWSRLQTRGKSIYVPLAESKIATKALKMPRATIKSYTTALKRIEKFRLKRVTRKRDVHLFMGTHVEAAPGTCKLPEITNP